MDILSQILRGGQRSGLPVGAAVWNEANCRCAAKSLNNLSKFANEKKDYCAHQVQAERLRRGAFGCRRHHPRRRNSVHAGLDNSHETVIRTRWWGEEMLPIPVSNDQLGIGNIGTGNISTLATLPSDLLQCLHSKGTPA